ncbi:hypothetical protein D4740_09895 [Actinomyces sp. 2119]|uniref:hypothetical protein n=1 Tax=Actinomyces sp. 2119 TaxID=2321393 RepID=UPI000E6B585F|nr:hypothetical protein [Actinomyces sp. 2119]RJF41213.1 hypothetical protein D4740_09895 [Actinomyces sp. 2119]
MSRDLEIDVDYAARITSTFSDAQDTLEEQAPTMPESVDGGDGADFVMSMLAKLGEDAGTLAQAAELGATHMKDAVDLITGYDEDVAQTFRSMAEDMS